VLDVALGVVSTDGRDGDEVDQVPHQLALVHECQRAQLEIAQVTHGHNRFLHP
jgi:hypothetical protein